jgi:hypothetical protein
MSDIVILVATTLPAPVYKTEMTPSDDVTVSAVCSRSAAVRIGLGLLLTVRLASVNSFHYTPVSACEQRYGDSSFG